jgi:hypothetical protein
MDEGMGLDPGAGRAFPGLWVRKHPSRGWSLSTSSVTPLLLLAWIFLLLLLTNTALHTFFLCDPHLC